jgi:hypothetical protein
MPFEKLKRRTAERLFHLKSGVSVMYLLSQTRRKIAPNELADHPFGQHSRDTQDPPFLERLS